MNSKQDETLLTIQEVAQIWDIPVSLIANIGSEANESRRAIDRFINSLRAYLNGTYLNGKRSILCRHSGKFRKFK
jgi:hypothetical protein